MKKYNMITSATPIPREIMRQQLPAIFATQPFHECSDKYRFISTVEVIDALDKEGFYPVMAGQTTPRRQDKHDFTKHTIRFRRDKDWHPDGNINEIVLTNSSDRGTAAILMGGIFRVVCMNGLIAGDISQEVRIKHINYVVDDFIEGAFTIVSQFDKINENKLAMQESFCSTEAYRDFATKALALRWPEPEAQPINNTDLLMTRRMADQKGDLWTKFNIVQENLLQGQRYYDPGKDAFRNTRKITGIDQVTKLNRGLWDLAAEYIDA